MAMKNVIFWDVTVRHVITDVLLLSVLQLLVTTNVPPNSLILFTMMMQVISPFETSVLTRATRRYIPEDGILHSHCRENLKSCIALTGLAV
jgi:hypothetical protein